MKPTNFLPVISIERKVKHKRLSSAPPTQSFDISIVVEYSVVLHLITVNATVCVYKLNLYLITKHI